MRAFATVSLLTLVAVCALACEELRPLVDKGGDNSEGTADVAASATGTGSTTGTGTGGAGGMSSSSSSVSSSGSAGGGMADGGKG